MGVKAKIGAGMWDILTCEACGNSWTGADVDLEWTDDPEAGAVECPACHSERVVREERG